MLTIHHLGESQSERIVWLCEELELAYALKIHARDSTTRLAPKEFKALHPMGIAPVIQDGDVLLGESGAICEYLVAKYGKGRLVVPPNHSNFAQFLFWFHFANGTLLPSAIGGIIGRSLDAAADNPILNILQSRTERAYAMVEKHLGEVDYFAGKELTIADIMMVFPLTTMRMVAPRDLSPFPNLQLYLQRIGGRPGYQRAMAKGDPGMPLQLS